MPIVCPFCPLHCDDLRVDADGAVNVDCPIAAANFAAALVEPSPPRIGDRIVSEQEIDAWLIDLIGQPGGRRIRTTGVPLSLARQLCRWQNTGGDDVLIDQSPTQAALRMAIGRDGTISATLADVKRHADLLWIVGDVASHTPRLLERLTDGDEQPRRKVIHWPAGATADTIAQLAALLRRRKKESDAKGDSVREVADEVEQLRSAIAAARYVAIVVAADAFAASEAISAAELLLTTTRWLNEPRGADTSRAVLVTLDPTQTLRAVAAWTSNQTPSTADPSISIRFGEALRNTIGDRQATGDEVANLSPGPVRLQIGGRDPGPVGAEAYVPTSIAGVHHSDAVIRGDGAVTLGLQAFATSPLPKPEKWLRPLR